MRRPPTALIAAVVACVLGLAAGPASAAPSAAQTARDRARVESAVEALESAQQEATRADALVQEASADLDRILDQTQRARDRLGSRARMMYRTGNTSFVWVLLGAESFRDFVTRWDLLVMMNRQDAADLATLMSARADAEQAAEELMALQVESARAVDEAAAQVARARADLAESAAALASYEARVAQAAEETAESPAASEPTPEPVARDSTQQLSGSGAWQVGVASHYGRSFTGGSASGERIGPYSMIVAHRTLPFGTLIEFEYDGRRAVAKVVDRGPHVPGRMFDLGPGVVRALDFAGVHEVRYRVIAQ